MLRKLWMDYDRVWVSFDKPDSRSLLNDQNVYWAHSPTNRNIKNLIKNFLLASTILHREKPTCIISTGAGIAIPFLLLGRVLGIKTVYIESFARKTDLSLTGKVVYWTTDVFFVQSQDLADRYRRAVYRGSVYQ